MAAESPRTIGVVTTTRADYSYYRPILRRIVSAPHLRLRLYVTGMHLSRAFGYTVTAIEEDGFEIAERIDMLADGDSPEAIAASIGTGVIGMSRAFARAVPDILLLLGDRFEMLASAAAALPFTVPLAHIAGGEATEGAVDDAIRHAITKMSHLHFVQTPLYGERVIQMGEEPWRVVVAGAASLDNLRDLPLMTRSELEAAFDVVLEPAPLVVTFHPVTLEHAQTAEHIRELLSALHESRMPVIFTATNADAQHRPVQAAIEQYVAAHPDARAVASFGTRGYFSLLTFASAVVGNSSSGIVEAATFELPVVNVGNRQAGRFHDRNVIDVPCERAAIVNAIRTASSGNFKQGLRGLRNPYGAGEASSIIVDTLSRVPLGSTLIVKRFHQIPAERSGAAS
jgi:UDP-N-acetylglucosamine 2-epimerase (non-hydrolysing)/GDP/UDP-N,N'-diacetylbacillosamine 2-epimerase (hydrolysing)